MPLRTRVFLAVLFALGLSSIQVTGMFDCNELPALSLGAGAATLLLAYMSIEGVVWAWRRSQWSPIRRTAVGSAIGLAGGTVALGLGAVTVVSHMCG